MRLTVGILTLFVLACSSGSTGGGATDGTSDAAATTGTDGSGPPGSDADSAESDAESDPESDGNQWSPTYAFEDLDSIEGMSVTSPAGGRELPLRLTYPTGATEPLPVVLWAHAGSWSNSLSPKPGDWVRVFASAGYAVIEWPTVRPTEAQLKTMCQDAGLQKASDCKDAGVTGDIPDGQDPVPFENPFNAITIARPADGAAVAESLPTIRDAFAMTGHSLDIDRPIVAGWSGGSQVAVQMAGAK